jgi:histidinol-phosphate aminotransferase
VEQLSELPGLRVFRSDANMILVRFSGDARGDSQAAAAAFAGLRARGVLVKNVSALHPMLANCLRLTVGLVEENRAMLAALKECL